MGVWAGWPPENVESVVRQVPAGRRTAWATTLVGAGAVAALVSGGLMLASQSRTTPTDTPVTVSSPPVSATRSLVRLEVTGTGVNTYGCGIVVAPGGMIATDASLLAAGGQIMAMTASGRREKATMVAIDTASDVAVLRVRSSLPVARFVDWSDVTPGTGAVEMAVEKASQGQATSTWWAETIASSGAAVSSGPGAGMASVVATTSNGVRPDGAVLMEHDGSVLGLLDRSGVSAAGGGSVFLPGQFVLQVARELMENDGEIEHGWLGIKGSDDPSGRPKGALVTSVDPDSAAAGHLQAGDVIEAVDGHRISSMADLRSRLYLLAPGSWVDLRIQRHAAALTVGLSLSETS
jgi:S1-C subfamily serine protease